MSEVERLKNEQKNEKNELKNLRKEVMKIKDITQKKNVNVKPVRQAVKNDKLMVNKLLHGYLDPAKTGVGQRIPTDLAGCSATMHTQDVIDLVFSGLDGTFCNIVTCDQRDYIWTQYDMGWDTTLATPVANPKYKLDLNLCHYVYRDSVFTDENAKWALDSKVEAATDNYGSTAVGLPQDVFISVIKQRVISPANPQQVRVIPVPIVPTSATTKSAYAVRFSSDTLDTITLGLNWQLDKFITPANDMKVRLSFYELTSVAVATLRTVDVVITALASTQYLSSSVVFTAAALNANGWIITGFADGSAPMTIELVNSTGSLNASYRLTDFTLDLFLGSTSAGVAKQNQTKFLKSQPIKDYDTIKQSVDAYRIVNSSMWTYMTASELNVDGSLSGDCMLQQVEPMFVSEGVRYNYANNAVLAAVPGSYTGKCAIGAYATYRPGSARDLEYRSYSQFLDFGNSYLIICGIVNTVNGRSGQCKIDTNWQFKSTSQQFSYADDRYDPILLASTFNSLSGFPRCQPNDLHFKKILSWIGDNSNKLLNLGSTIFKGAGILGSLL